MPEQNTVQRNAEASTVEPKEAWTTPTVLSAAFDQTQGDPFVGRADSTDPYGSLTS